MNKRVAVLLFLAVCILIVRGATIDNYFFGNAISPRLAGIITDVEGQNLTVKTVVQRDASHHLETAGFKAGVREKDRIIGVYNARGEGGPIHGLADWGRYLKEVRFDEPWTLEVLRGDTVNPQHVRIQIPATPSSLLDYKIWLFLGLIGVVVPFVAIFTGFFIGFMKPEDDNAFTACLLFLGFSFLFGMPHFSFPGGVRELSLILQNTFAAFVVYLFTRFFLLFPSPSVIDRKAPWLKHLFLWLSVFQWAAALCVAFATAYSFELYARIERSTAPWDIVFSVIAIAMFVTGLLSLILNTVKAQTKDDRRKMRILLSGSLIGLIPLLVFLTYVGVSNATIVSLWPIAVVAVTMAVFPLSFIYVIMKHRVLGIRLILRRGLQYAFVSHVFLVVEGILIFLAIYVGLGTVKLSSQTPNTGLLAVGAALMAIVLVILLRRVNQRLMPALDRRFFREAYNAQHVLTDLSRAVRRLAGEPEKLFDLVTDKISDSLYPDQVAIFLRTDSGSYDCHGLRVRSGHHDETWCNPDVYQDHRLQQDAFLSLHLEKIAADEPETLDVYVNDPKSWANALARVSSETDKRYQEKILLESLNARMIVPLMTNNRVLGFVSLGEKLSEEAYSKEDKELLLSVAEQTAIALEFSKMITQIAEQKKMEREIQIAKEVQERLFPQTLPPMRTLEYTGVCRSARGVGGDYYDFLLLGNDRLGIALGDVAGKGISAALLMASLQALLRSGAPLRGEMLNELIGDINRLMCSSSPGNKYATFFYGLYEDNRRRLTYVNAGHLPPMLFRQNGRRSQLPALDRLGSGGMVVGMFEEAVYRKDVVEMSPGDLLLLFSDGISEAMNEVDEEFGEERLAHLVASNLHLSVLSLQDLIVDEVVKFAGTAPQSDDMTLVLARVL